MGNASKAWEYFRKIYQKDIGASVPSISSSEPLPGVVEDDDDDDDDDHHHRTTTRRRGSSIGAAAGDEEGLPLVYHTRGAPSKSGTYYGCILCGASYALECTVDKFGHKSNSTLVKHLRDKHKQYDANTAAIGSAASSPSPSSAGGAGGAGGGGNEAASAAAAMAGGTDFMQDMAAAATLQQEEEDHHHHQQQQQQEEVHSHRSHRKSGSTQKRKRKSSSSKTRGTQQQHDSSPDPLLAPPGSHFDVSMLHDAGGEHSSANNGSDEHTMAVEEVFAPASSRSSRKKRKELQKINRMMDDRKHDDASSIFDTRAGSLFSSVSASAASDSLVDAQGGGSNDVVSIPERFSFSTESFFLPVQYKDCVSGVMIPHGMIQSRVEKLAADILRDYDGLTPHFLCVLQGGQRFYTDLTNYLNKLHGYRSQFNCVPFTSDFVRVKSYQGTSSTGNVSVEGLSRKHLENRDVVVIEDIIDSGLTMQELVPILKQDAKSVRVASLLEKRTERSCGFRADYVGFTVPDSFIVGYNLDYDGAFRDLSHICVINDTGMQRFKGFDDSLSS